MRLLHSGMRDGSKKYTHVCEVGLGKRSSRFLFSSFCLRHSALEWLVDWCTEHHLLLLTPPLFSFQGFFPLPRLERLSSFLNTAKATPRPATVGSEDLFLKNSSMNMRGRCVFVAEEDRTSSEGPGR